MPWLSRDRSPLRLDCRREEEAACVALRARAVNMHISREWTQVDQADTDNSSSLDWSLFCRIDSKSINNTAEIIAWMTCSTAQLWIS